MRGVSNTGFAFGESRPTYQIKLIPRSRPSRPYRAVALRRRSPEKTRAGLLDGHCKSATGSTTAGDTRHVHPLLIDWVQAAHIENGIERQTESLQGLSRITRLVRTDKHQLVFVEYCFPSTWALAAISSIDPNEQAVTVTGLDCFWNVNLEGFFREVVFTWLGSGSHTHMTKLEIDPAYWAAGLKRDGEIAHFGRLIFTM